jgi:sigma-E factor negative regulatory protein RseC
MSGAGDGLSGPEDHGMIEGTARVVAVENGLAVLEPEQTTACGGCHAAAACGVQPGNRRLVARRFSLPNDHDLAIGERVVVGVPERTLVRASILAFGLPMVTTLGAGLVAQRVLGAGDGTSALAALGGLALGLLLVHLRARVLGARGALTPHFIRRALGSGPGGTCHT